jgi:hypothetical protein
VRVIGIGINATEASPFPFQSGDRLMERNFLHEIDAVKFATQQWEGKEALTHMLLRIDKQNPKVIAVLDLRRGVVA